MRISDWSADVCSSDLPVGLVETVVASSGLSEAVPAAAPPLGLKARLLLAGFGAAMALGLIWAGQREKRVALLTHDKQGRGNGASGEIGRAHVELQSLMRISYAVFCLKKKKNNTTSILEHHERDKQ